MSRINMVKPVALLTMMSAGLMLISACTCTTCQEGKAGTESKVSATATAPASPAPTVATADTKVERMFIPMQTDPKSEVIREISQGLGQAFMKMQPANLIIVDDLKDATCVFKLSLKAAKFSDTDWVEDKAGAKPVAGQDGLNGKEFKRTARYQVEVEYAVQGQKPGAADLKGAANGEASHELTFRQQVETKNPNVRPKFPEIPSQAEREKELAVKCGQELVKEISQKLSPYFTRKN